MVRWLTSHARCVLNARVARPDAPPENGTPCVALHLWTGVEPKGEMAQSNAVEARCEIM